MSNHVSLTIYILIIINLFVIICQPIINNCSSSATIYDRVSTLLDISWSEYLQNVYGNNAQQIQINKNNISFIYKNISVYIKLMFMNELLKDNRPGLNLRIHNKKHIQSNSWIEVIRYPIISLWKDFPSEGYTSPNWTRSFKHHYISPMKVPYGCWFYPVIGSGIYINVGKILIINNKYSNELSLINPGFNMHTRCMYNDSAVTCYDKYVCSAVLAKKFDSIQILETNELIICSGKCATEEVKGSCPPIELRRGYPHTTLEYCNCSEDSNMLNCGKNIVSMKSYSSKDSYISSSNNSDLNRTSLSYRPVACIALVNTDNNRYFNDFDLRIFFSPIIAAVSSEDLEIIVRNNIISSNNSSKSQIQISGNISHYTALFVYLNKNISSNIIYLHINIPDNKGKYSFPYYHYPNSLEANNLHYTWLFPSKTNIVAIHINYIYSNVTSMILDIKSFRNGNKVWNRIGFVIYNMDNYTYEYNDIKLLSRQIIDEVMCLHTSGVNFIVLLNKSNITYMKINDFYSQLIPNIRSYIDIWITIHDDVHIDVRNCSINKYNDLNETRLFILHTSSYETTIMNSLLIERNKTNMKINENIYIIE